MKIGKHTFHAHRSSNGKVERSLLFLQLFFWLVVVAVELLFQFGCGRIGDIWVAFERVRKNLSTRYGFENISKTHGSV